MWFSFDKDVECSSLILFAILNYSSCGMITEIVSLNIFMLDFASLWNVDKILSLYM